MGAQLSLMQPKSYRFIALEFLQFRQSCCVITPPQIMQNNRPSTAKNFKLLGQTQALFSKEFSLKFVRWSMWGSIISSAIFTALAAIDPNFALTTTTGVEGLQNLMTGSVSLSTFGTAVIGVINVLFMAIAGFSIYSKTTAKG